MQESSPSPKRLSAWVQTLLLAALYAATGKLGITLAIPPGYATFIWPPSGIAIGMLLLSGPRLWPGVALGSFLINAWVNGAVGQDGIAWTQAVTALAIACGATLQALAGWALTRYILGLPLELNSIRQTLTLFVLIGPLACIIAATVGTWTLFFTESLPLHSLASHWWTWWGGDVLGVLVFTPLVLIFPYTKGIMWKGRRMESLPVLAMLALMLPLGISFYSWKVTHEYIYERKLSLFNDLAQENQKALIHRAEFHRQALLGGMGVFKASQSVSREEWRSYVQSIDLAQEYPGLLGMGYISAVPQDTLASYEAAQRADGSPQFTIHPKTDAADHFIITFIEPYGRNKQAAGLDIAFEERRREAAILARDSGKTTVTRPISLVQDTSQTAGFLLLHPMYRTDMPTRTREQRKAAFQGWIYAPVFARSLLNNLTQSQGALLHLRVYDGESALEENLIYDSAKGVRLSAPSFKASGSVELMQRRWLLEWCSTPAFDTSVRRNEPVLVLAGGLAITALFGAFLLALAQRTQTVHRLVDEKVEVIQASENRLKMLIQHTPAAVAMFDREMRYILTSERWITDYHLKGIALIGRSHYDVFPEILRMPAWLDVHRRALQGEVLTSQEDNWKRADGQREWVRWSVHPWMEAGGQIGGIAMFTEVITDKKNEEMRAHLLKEIAIEAAEANSIPGILLATLEKMYVFQSWHVGHVYLWSEKHKALESSRLWHFGPGSESKYSAFRALSESMTFPSGTGMPGMAVQSRAPVFIKDLKNDPVFLRAKQGENFSLRSGAAFPVFVDDQVTAVLEFFSFDTLEETKEMREFLETLSLQLSRAIERKRFEQALKDSNRFNQTLLASARHMFIATDQKGTILLFNPEAERALGYQAQEVEGRLTPILWHDPQEIKNRARELGETYGEKIEPGFEVFVYVPLREGAETREWTVIRKDGSRFPVTLSVSPMRDSEGEIVGFLGVTEDITERKRQQAELAEREAKLSNIVEHAVDGLIVIDDHGIIQTFNPACEKLFGYAASEAIGKNVSILMPEHYAKHHDAYLQRYRQTAPQQGVVGNTRELEGRRKDGSSFPLDLSISEIHIESKRIFSGIVRDITARKKVESELRQARQQAEEAARLKSEFLANMSHEIRTPMNGVIGMTHLLMDTELTAQQRHYTETVAHSADALMQIINDILDLSKIEAGKMTMEVIPFDLQVLCDEVADMMAVKAREKKVELILRYPYGCPRRLVGDPGRIRQILFNLCGNSVKFTQKGHVLIGVNVLQTTGHASIFRITIEDTGIGIPKDKLSTIFNKFDQVETGTTRKYGGTGLGLSICQQLVEMMEGRIGVESEEGKGSAFWVEIPLEHAADSHEEPLENDIPALSGLLALVVDDYKVARETMSSHLESIGMRVHAIEDSSQAIDTLLAAKKAGAAFDFAILDCMMPGMDGMELCRRIRKTPELEGLICVMATSQPTRGDATQARESGFNGYLTKPLHPHELVGVLALLRNARLRGMDPKLVTRYTLLEHAGRPAETKEKASFDSVRALLVEDNFINQEIIVALLEEYGIRSTVAANGKEAVECMESGERFDIVFMDCQMPIMDGFEATRTIRRIEREQNKEALPIIALTANAMQGDKERCLQSGMNDYMSKPIDIVELERMLKTWLPDGKLPINPSGETA